MTNATIIIAEAGVNHNGSLSMALELIDAAADAGADVVKFQTFKSEAMISRLAVKADYQKKTTGSEETQLEMVKKLELDADAHRTLISHCVKRGIRFLSTPFDFESLVLLAHDFDLPTIKMSSGDLTNAPLLLEVAKTGKQVILSTGMSNLGEIETALGVLAYGYAGSRSSPSRAAFEAAYGSSEGRQALLDKVTLLHCTTEYPAPFDEVNLQAMLTLQSAFALPVGYSDHTQGIAIPIAAVALGAVMIEKHFTLDRNLPGPDHKASLEPHELAQMVRAIREVKAALGSPVKQPSASELKNRLVARKSLVAATDIVKGELLTPENLTVKRPGEGINPVHYWEWLGKRADRDYRQDEKIQS